MELWLSVDEQEYGYVTLTLHEPHESTDEFEEKFFSPNRLDQERSGFLDSDGGLLFKIAKELGVEPGTSKKIVLEIVDDE